MVMLSETIVSPLGTVVNVYFMMHCQLYHCEGSTTDCSVDNVVKIY